jgi:hypothetical protein
MWKIQPRAVAESVASAVPDADGRRLRLAIRPVARRREARATISLGA